MDALAIHELIPLAVIPAFFGSIAWVAVTRLKVKNGYPLSTASGQLAYPHNAGETEERLRLLTQENARLRAELGAIKDRLVTVERIVTDSPHRLDREIEILRGSTR